MRFIDFEREKYKKKYLEAPKSKTAAQFKMAAEIGFTSKIHKPSF
jgi:hypothetical protein